MILVMIMTLIMMMRTVGAWGAEEEGEVLEEGEPGDVDTHCYNDEHDA